MNKQSGVTLVETLVALAIMGLVTASILVLIGQNTRFTASAQDRTYASIAADNLMVEALAHSGVIEIGETSGDINFAAREWRYRRTISETSVRNLLRIDIQILDGVEGQVIANVTTLRKAGS